MIDNSSLLYTMLFVSFILIILSIISKKSFFRINSANIYFTFFSVALISIFSLLSFSYPKFSFGFMVFVTCILTVLTMPFNIFPGFVVKQQNFFNKFLIFLDKTLILDYFSVIFVKFFCVPSQFYFRRLILIFCINFVYIMCSRGVFVHVVFWNQPLQNKYEFFIYIILFIGIAIIYLRLLINLSMFLVYSALRVNPSLLSPSILYVLGQDDSDLPNIPKSGISSQNPSDRKFSFINVSFNKEYYRQYFNNANPNGFRYMGYGLAICGTVVACGTFWYTRVQAQAAVVQAQAAIVQAEQAKVQSYHTAREADVAAIEANLITKEEYYRRHPEDDVPQK